MKTKRNLLKRLTAVAAFALLSILALSSCKKDDNKTNNTPYTISGNGSGSQMVPSVTGTGGSTITGTYDPKTGVMNYTTNWTNMTGAPTSGGFYSGASGTNGAAIGSPWTFGTGLTGNGTSSGTITLTSDQASQLINGNMYYTMGTAANTGGEVRGQITATR